MKIDGFSMQERLPTLDSFIKDKYSYLVTIDDNEFWSRNIN